MRLFKYSDLNTNTLTAWTPWFTAAYSNTRIPTRFVKLVKTLELANNITSFNVSGADTTPFWWIYRYIHCIEDHVYRSSWSFCRGVINF